MLISQGIRATQCPPMRAWVFSFQSRRPQTDTNICTQNGVSPVPCPALDPVPRLQGNLKGAGSKAECLPTHAIEKIAWMGHRRVSSRAGRKRLWGLRRRFFVFHIATNILFAPREIEGLAPSWRRTGMASTLRYAGNSRERYRLTATANASIPRLRIARMATIGINMVTNAASAIARSLRFPFPLGFAQFEQLM